MSAQKQQTLASSAALTGTSLHTGQQVTSHDDAGSGEHRIKFRRVDLPDKPFIDAHVSKVQTVERATTLAEGSVKVHTVEHVISALVGMGVDNAIIEMDANEPPIGDGSALPFVDCIKKAGIVEQEANRRVFEIREPIHLETKTDLAPHDRADKGFRVSCTQVGPNGRMTQYFSTEITPETYEKEIAHARTFVYYEDVQPLLEKGLIKGGSLENAVVVKGDSVMSKEAMRLSRGIRPPQDPRHHRRPHAERQTHHGHVIAVKPGHGPNTQMAEKLAKTFAQTLAPCPPSPFPRARALMNNLEVQKILPHRYPFLMVDRIIGFESEFKCTGVKQVTINEPYFQGHFPGHPVMPGVLQVEAMAQVASVYPSSASPRTRENRLFMSADSVKFRKPVFPGDTLIIESELTKVRGNIGVAKCRCCTVNGETTSEGELKFALMD